MKKITPEIIVNQINQGIEKDIASVTAMLEIAQEKRGMQAYLKYLEDAQGILRVLNQPPFAGMFASLIQSAIDTKAD